MNLFLQRLRHIPLRYYLVFIPGLIVILLFLIYIGGRGIGGTFIYPLRILFHQLNGVSSLTFWILAFLCLLFFILIFAFARNKYNRMLTFTTVGLMLFSCWSTVLYLPPFFDTGWRELDSVSTGSHRYYLAIYESASDGYFYYLYRCDGSGVFCTQIAEVVDWRYPWSILVHLEINNNRLQVVVDNGEILFELD